MLGLIVVSVLAVEHPAYAIGIGVPVVVVLVLYFGRQIYKSRKTKRELAQAVEDRRHFWRVAQMVPGTFSVYLSSVKEQDEAAVRSCLENLAQNPAVDLDVDNVLRRVHHKIGPQAVVTGVDEDIAIDLKEELEHWGGKVRVKEDALVQVRHNGHREPIPERVRHEVWRRDGGQCVDCGSRERLEFDHIVPWSKGGANTARNLELRCESCNRKKAAKI